LISYFDYILPSSTGFFKCFFPYILVFVLKKLCLLVLYFAALIMLIINLFLLMKNAKKQAHPFGQACLHIHF